MSLNPTTQQIMEFFVKGCKEGGYSLLVWIDKPPSLVGHEAICYYGCLSDCEKVEVRIIPWIQQVFKDSLFCYVYPPPDNAISTLIGK